MGRKIAWRAMDAPPPEAGHYLVWCTIRPHFRVIPYAPGSAARLWGDYDGKARIPVGAIAWRPLPAAPKVKYELDLGGEEKPAE